MIPGLLASAHRFGGTQVVLIAIVVVLIGCTGFLAMSETALTRMSKAKAVSLVEEGRRRSKTLLWLVEHIDRVLPVVLS